jgi:hypothetical protein
MTLTAKRVFPLLTLLAIAFVVGGCLVGVSGYRETPVYGDYGYVGPWYSGQIEVEGGHFVPPPYGHSDRDRRDDDSHRREHAAPERTAQPQRPPAPRPVPSIPNNPRPEHQHGGNDKNQR